MRKTSLMLMVLLFAGLTAFAQDEGQTDDDVDTEVKQKKRRYKGEVKTISGDNYHSGGFGAISFKGTDYMEQTMIMAGIRGGWIINRAVALGFEGWGVIPTVKLKDVYPVNEVTALGGYGGFFIEPIFFSNEIVHLTLPLSMGAGWLGYEETSNNFDYQGNLVSDDVFWYIEPGVAMEINVSRSFRIDLGASKRFTQDLELLNTPSDAFDAWNYFLTLKFGGF